MRSKYPFIILVQAACALALHGCGAGGGTEGGLLPVPGITAAYRYQFAIVDTLTGSPITDPLTVRFTGPAVNDSEVVDSANASTKDQTYTVASGFFTAGANFNGKDDVFTITAGNLAKGWNTSGVQILRETSTAGDQIVIVKLTNVKSAANVNADTGLGVAMATTTAAVSNGANAAPITLTTAAKQVTNAQGALEPVGTAKISIPAGTVMRDSAGNVASGNLTVTATKYSNNETRSLSSFPGGFTVQVSDPTGTALEGGAASGVVTFVTGGFAQFNLTDAAGKPIKKFDTPITLSIDLPKNSTNPSTGSVVKPGDTYPVWSFDETAGNWTFQGNGTISVKQPDDPANYEVVFTSTHLTYWNLDYRVDNCTSHLPIVGRPAGDLTPLLIKIEGAPGTNFYREIPNVVDSALDLANAPNMWVRITASTANGTVVGTLEKVNLCSLGGAVLRIQLPNVFPDGTPNGDIVSATLTVRVTAACVAEGLDRPPTEFINTSVWFLADNGFFQSGTSPYTFNLGFGPKGSFSVHGTLSVWDPFNKRTISNRVIVSGGAPFGTTIPIQTLASPPCPVTGGQGH